MTEHDEAVLDCDIRAQLDVHNIKLSCRMCMTWSSVTHVVGDSPRTMTMMTTGLLNGPGELRDQCDLSIAYGKLHHEKSAGIRVGSSSSTHRVLHTKDEPSFAWSGFVPQDYNGHDTLSPGCMQVLIELSFPSICCSFYAPRRL